MLGVVAPGDCCPGVRSPPDPEGLTSLDAGNESPVGPIVNEGPCFGCGWVTPATSDDDVGRDERAGFLGDPGTAKDD